MHEKNSLRYKREVSEAKSVTVGEWFSEVEAARPPEGASEARPVQVKEEISEEEESEALINEIREWEAVHVKEETSEQEYMHSLSDVIAFQIKDGTSDEDCAGTEGEGISNSVPTVSFQRRGTSEEGGGLGKRRKLNFSVEENEVLVNFILQNYGVLYGVGGIRGTLTQKYRLWQEVKEKVNRLGHCAREVEDLKKRWRDIKRKVKDKLSKQRQAAATPGANTGPPQDISLTILEEKVASTFHKESLESVEWFDSLQPPEPVIPTSWSLTPSFLGISSTLAVPPTLEAPFQLQLSELEPVVPAPLPSDEPATLLPAKPALQSPDASAEERPQQGEVEGGGGNSVEVAGAPGKREAGAEKCLSHGLPGLTLADARAEQRRRRPCSDSEGQVTEVDILEFQQQQLQEIQGVRAELGQLRTSMEEQMQCLAGVVGQAAGTLNRMASHLAELVSVLRSFAPPVSPTPVRPGSGGREPAAGSSSTSGMETASPVSTPSGSPGVPPTSLPLTAAAPTRRVRRRKRGEGSNLLLLSQLKYPRLLSMKKK
ncbi:uncharacterized protein LOC102353983 [Latimeria chalumnae]|uniref:uncharacterized protein LOC102353983 n=1 Tax=Latimeria chalumnae TaxID=7897 RepID=UPI0003C1A4C3|nr:PREDICTED: uncharacterized protein LOC102353983 [Latimeria chalumnae]|eukprot:XP_014345140.1 PREDICTED: uncharacterized protein LOC102353983 [Latimeria chalumnae]